MLLPSCDVLANEQPSLVELITNLDRRLASAEGRREVRLSDLAYVVHAESDVVESLLERLVELKAVKKEQRFCCPDEHHLFTSEDLKDAQNEGSALRCPQCRKWLRGDVLTTVSIYNVVEETRYPSDEGLRDAKRVLVISVNSVVDPLNLDQEMRQIQRALDGQNGKAQIALDFLPAATVADLRRALLRGPVMVIHFSGHGANKGLYFVNDVGDTHIVKGKPLATLLGTFRDQIHCVVLNACYSVAQAKVIAEHITYVIGMRGSVDDDAAIAFAAAFYEGLAAGETVLRSFKLGYNAIDLTNLKGSKKPVIWYRGSCHEAGQEPSES
jgi:hypothetical protein